MDKHLSNLIQERMPKFKPLGCSTIGMPKADLERGITFLIEGLPEGMKHLVDPKTGAYDLIAMADMQTPLRVRVKENTGSPVHTYLHNWMPNGTPYRKNAGEPPIQGTLKCGLNWAWLKWARDFYGISLVAARRVGLDFIEQNGEKLYGSESGNS